MLVGSCLFPALPFLLRAVQRAGYTASCFSLARGHLTMMRALRWEWSLLPGRAEPREQCPPGVRSCVGKCVLLTPHQLVRWLCSLLTRSVLHSPWEITPISTMEMFFIDGEKIRF